MFPCPAFQVGDTVFHVLNDGPCYRIRKSRITEVTKRKTSRLFFEKSCYRCEDGYRFESLSSLRPYFIFTTMREAVSHVVKDLQSQIEYEKSYCITARQELDRLNASLRVFELLGGISLLSPEYLLSFERRTFHADPPDHYARLSQRAEREEQAFHYEKYERECNFC